MRLDNDQALNAIARLSTNSDFEVFMEHIVRKQHTAALKECVWEPNPAQAQGKAQALDMIISTVDGARDAARERMSAVTPVAPASQVTSL